MRPIPPHQEFTVDTGRFDVNELVFVLGRIGLVMDNLGWLEFGLFKVFAGSGMLGSIAGSDW